MTEPTPEAGRVWNDNVGDLRNYILELEVKVTTQAETIRRLEGAIANHEEAHRVGLANERAQRETIRRLEDEKRLLLDTIARREKDIDAMEQRAEAAEQEVARLTLKRKMETEIMLGHTKAERQRAEAAEGRLDIARCTLADIAGSRDMTLFIARRKAQRTYDETAAVEEAAE